MKGVAMGDVKIVHRWEQWGCVEFKSVVVMAQEDSQAGQQVSDNIVSEFGTYQEFLDSQITRKDLFYLEVREYLWYIRQTHTHCFVILKLTNTELY